MYWFVFCHGLNLKFDLRASEMQRIQIQVQTSYLDRFQIKPKKD